MKMLRRNYLINKRLQLGYVGLVTWFIALTIILICGLTYYFSLNTIIDVISRQNLNLNLWKIVTEINVELQKRIAVSFLFLAGLAGVVMTLYLHRVAGPVYRLQKSFNDWAAGKEYKPVKFRDKDAFHSLAEAVNAFAGKSAAEKKQIEDVLSETGLSDAEKISKLKEVLKQFV